MTPKSVAQLTLYPETGAGGYSHVDGTIEFYTRISALIDPGMTIVDFGAGRGAAAFDDPVAYRRQLRCFKGRVARVIGIDVDPVIRDNPTLDQALVVKSGEALPLLDRSVDMIISDYIFEHIADPAIVAAEFARIIKPGGWVCARTPNRYGYVAIAARIVPSILHNRLLSRAQPDRKEGDVFPKYYRLNTWRAIRKHFPECLWDSFIYTVNAEPAYFGGSMLAWRAMMLFFRMTPRRFGANFMIFLRRNDGEDRALSGHPRFALPSGIATGGRS